MSMHIEKYMNSGPVKRSSARWGTWLTIRTAYSRLASPSIRAEAARHSRVLQYDPIFPCSSLLLGVSRKIIPIVAHTAQLKTYAISEYMSIVIAFYTFVYAKLLKSAMFVNDVCLFLT